MVEVAPALCTSTSTRPEVAVVRTGTMPRIRVGETEVRVAGTPLMVTMVFASVPKPTPPITNGTATALSGKLFTASTDGQWMRFSGSLFAPVEKADLPSDLQPVGEDGP